jgi:hypothetical protein
MQTGDNHKHAHNSQTMTTPIQQYLPSLPTTWCHDWQGRTSCISVKAHHRLPGFNNMKCKGMTRDVLCQNYLQEPSKIHH